MTQIIEDARKVEEIKAVFMSLDNQGQEDALSILRSLNLAQSALHSSKQEERLCEQYKNE